MAATEQQHSSQQQLLVMVTAPMCNYPLFKNYCCGPPAGKQQQQRPAGKAWLAATAITAIAAMCIWSTVYLLLQQWQQQRQPEQQ
jgi:hypothetical protein